jgi:hypothetical protein
VTAGNGDERLEATLDGVEARLDRFGARVAGKIDRLRA